MDIRFSFFPVFKGHLKLTAFTVFHNRIIQISAVAQKNCVCVFFFFLLLL